VVIIVKLGRLGMLRRIASFAPNPCLRPLREMAGRVPAPLKTLKNKGNYAKNPPRQVALFDGGEGHLAIGGNLTPPPAARCSTQVENL
jgi:hypothetical protein